MKIPDNYKKKKQRFLERVLDSIQDEIIILDRDLTIIDVNRVVEQRFKS